MERLIYRTFIFVALLFVNYEIMCCVVGEVKRDSDTVGVIPLRPALCFPSGFDVGAAADKTT